MQQKPQRYILGLDLGIASVGWACVWADENEHPIGLLDCGVRTFERAEVPKTGGFAGFGAAAGAECAAADSAAGAPSAAFAPYAQTRGRVVGGGF